MKNIFKTVALSALLILGVGCKDYLDVNTDPNNPADVTMDLLLPSTQASAAIVIGGVWGNLGGFWAQYYTQAPDAGQYEVIDAYNITTDYFDNQWREWYAGGLIDAEIIKQKANEEGNNKYFLIATLMEAYMFQYLVDLHDKVPYSEAFAGATTQNLNPKFDDGDDIYADLLAKIDAAVSRYESDNITGSNPANDDIIYGGDMDQWISFANSLKLKLYMRMSYTSMADGNAVMALINTNNFITQDASMTQFVDELSRRNPWYEIEVDRLGGVNQRASNTMIKYLQANDDPRINSIYIPGSGGHLAKEQGDFANRDIPNDDLSSVNITATTPVYLMTKMEMYFLIAEAMVRYNSGNGAQAAYEAGIDESFAMNGVVDTNNIYGPGGPYEYTAGGGVETEIGQIMMQKWIGLANVNPLEAYIEINRTHYPPVSGNGAGNPGGVGELTISYASVLSAGQTPKRVWYPEIEIVRNSSTPSQPAGGLTAKVWWDKK